MLLFRILRAKDLYCFAVGRKGGKVQTTEGPRTFWTRGEIQAFFQGNIISKSFRVI